MQKLFVKQIGKKRVEVQRDNYGINISFTKNGWQSTVVQVPEDMLDMIIDVIDEFKKSES